MASTEAVEKSDRQRLQLTDFCAVNGQQIQKQPLGVAGRNKERFPPSTIDPLTHVQVERCKAFNKFGRGARVVARL